ncbi:MAG: hypothetical protein MI866_17150 [Bacteroidales bacterium]|nr:hypothetical protein [Bacteroidales bacterium]
MRNLKYILLLIIVFTSCQKESIDISDFDWVVEFQRSRREPPFVLEISLDNTLLLANKNSFFEFTFEGKVVVDSINNHITKSKAKIYFYSKTYGTPLLGNGRKSLVVMSDTCIFKDVFLLDKTIVKAKIDRNEDEFQKYIQFKRTGEEKIHTFRFNEYDNIVDVYDIVQVDKSHFAITFRKYKPNLESTYCIGVLNLSNLIR